MPPPPSSSPPPGLVKSSTPIDERREGEAGAFDIIGCKIPNIVKWIYYCQPEGLNTLTTSRKRSLGQEDYSLSHTLSPVDHKGCERTLPIYLFLYLSVCQNVTGFGSCNSTASTWPDMFLGRKDHGSTEYRFKWRTRVSRGGGGMEIGN